jgi:hypothetical protein
MPWRLPGLRKDACRGGVPLDPWERREEDVMAIAVVIFFLRMKTAATVRNMWTRGYEPYADGSSAPVWAGERS